MNLSFHQSRHRSTVFIILVALVFSLTPMFLFVTGVHAEDNHAISPFAFSFKGIHYIFAQASQAPPTDVQCRARIGHPCYSPQEIRRAYGVTPLIQQGYTGKGQTIVIIDSFGSPTIRRDLKVFDQGYGLPDPPSFKILAPLGTIQFNPNNSDMVNWAFETTLDVDWAHAMAPDANIVLMTSPVSETEGVQGMPEFLYLEQYAYKHHLGQIISQSWGATENTLFTPGGRQVLNSFNSFYKLATEAGWSVFASSGDSGAANVDINGHFYPFPTVIFPASSPYVTAVGGTSLYANTQGVYDHETVWNNSIGASGGGISQYFKEPSYQRNNLPSSVQAQLHGYRGIPDISWNADPETSILVYISFLGGSNNGFYFIGGTSEGSPQWAGITADADQWAGHSLGLLNPALYRLGNSNAYKESFHDITVGNNSFAGVPGYDAMPGWDLATGLGTPKAANLLSELIG
jgi:subtilase family serine protease